MAFFSSSDNLPDFLIFSSIFSIFSLVGSILKSKSSNTVWYAVPLAAPVSLLPLSMNSGTTALLFSLISSSDLKRFTALKLSSVSSASAS